MKSRLAVLSSLSLLLAALVPAHAAENKPPEDPRLSQLVTLEMTGERLHTVCEKLTAMTHVSIHCGSKKEDWHVRDLPVVVCVKDLPLGTLLQALADSNHLLLSKNKVGDSSTFGYRIWRDAKREKELTREDEESREMAYKQAVWDWDAVAKFNDIPDSAYNFALPGRDAGTIKLMQDALDDPLNKATSALFAALGPDTRDKVLSGETIRTRPKDNPPAVRSAMENLLRASNRALMLSTGQQGESTADWVTPSQEDLDNATLVIRSNNTEIHMSSAPGSNAHYRLAEPRRIASLTREANTPLLSKPPLMPGLGSAQNNSFPQSWNKLAIEPPKDNKDPTYVDALVAAAKAAGYNLVCNDFHSHKDYPAYDSKQCFGSVSFGEMLQMKCFWNTWTTDETNRLVVGSDRNWKRWQQNLVPESVVRSLVDKSDAEGIELDDVTPLAGFTREQMDSWLVHSKQLGWLGQKCAFDQGKDFWTLYDSLNAQDRAAARSHGISLASFDISWLIQKATEMNQEATWRFPITDDPQIIQARKLSGFLQEIPTDPEVVSRLVMRVLEGTVMNDKRAYSLVLFDPQAQGLDAQRGVCRFRGPNVSFPVYSPQRQAELDKQNATQAGSK